MSNDDYSNEAKPLSFSVLSLSAKLDQQVERLKDSKKFNDELQDKLKEIDLNHSRARLGLYVCPILFAMNIFSNWSMIGTISITFVLGYILMVFIKTFIDSRVTLKKIETFRNEGKKYNQTLWANDSPPNIKISPLYSYGNEEKYAVFLSFKDEASEDEDFEFIGYTNDNSSLLKTLDEIQLIFDETKNKDFIEEDENS